MSSFAILDPPSIQLYPRLLSHPSPARTICAILSLLFAAVACSGPSDILDSRGAVTVPSDTVNIVQLENALQGSASWEMSYKTVSPDSLSVFAAPYDVVQNDTLRVYANSKFATLMLQVFRVGFYGGLGARLVYSDTLSSAGSQPPCSAPFPGPVQCKWAITASLAIRPEWVAGLYLLKLTSSNGVSAGYPIVIRSSQLRPDFVLVIPVFSWQAYNAFGGSSLYVVDPNTSATVPRVSFSRPYASSLQRFDLAGSDVRSAISFFESTGYNVGYVSDLTFANPQLPQSIPRRGYVFVGHDEYWTWDEFSRAESVRDQGGHLAFFAANNAFFNIRIERNLELQRDNDIVVCYKVAARDLEASESRFVTTQFRMPPLNRPENGLSGTLWRGTRAQGSVTPPDYIVTDASLHGAEGMAFLQAAGLKAGDSLHVSLHGEGDRTFANSSSPLGLQVLLHTTYVGPSEGTFENDLTFYRASSGAGVFSAGNNAWPGFLEGRFYNAKAASLTKAIIDWMAHH